MISEQLKDFYESSLSIKATLFSIAFLFFRFTTFNNDSIVDLTINEILFIHVVYFWFYWGIKKIVLKRNLILSFFNLLILLSSIFLIIVSGISLFIKERTFSEIPSIIQIFLILSIAIVVFVILQYSFIILSKFYFYRQKGNQKGFFRAMIILLLLYGILKTFIPYLKETYDIATLFPAFFSSINSFTTIVEISLGILIVLNSMRVSWIAKLSKKEKIGLIIRSFFVSGILFVSLILLNVNEQGEYILKHFSYLFYYSTTFVLFYGSINAGMVFFTTIFHLPTAEESDKKTEELSMLWGLGKMLNEIFDLQELGESIVTLAKQAGNTNEVSLIIVSNNEKILIHVEMKKEIIEKLFNQFARKKDNFKYLILDINNSSGSDILPRYGIERLLAIPLFVKNERRGYLFLARKFGEENFDDDEIDAVIGLADFASLALSKAELLKASIEKERMEKELELAREIQRKIIPEKIPTVKNFEISAQFIPAFEVGGDYYDFFNLKDATAFVIADVSGKGIEASYTMAEMKGIFEALSQTDESIDKLIIRANEILLKRLNKKSFVTAIIGIVYESEILYYRLGHNKPVLVTGNDVKIIDSNGLAFGIASSEIFAKNLQPVRLPIKKDEIIVFYTDGINEAMNNKKEEFGYKRFFEILNFNKGKSADQIALTLIKEISLFANSNFQNDDITILIFKRK